MPKVVYSASKGLYQESGSGFEIGDVSVVEASEAIENGTDTVVATHGTSVLTVGAGSDGMSLAVNTNVGATKFIVSPTNGGGSCTVTASGKKQDGTTLASLIFNAAGEHAQLISDGTQWICVSAVTGVEA